MNVAELKTSFDRHEDLYIYYYLDANRAGLQEIYNNITALLPQFQENPQYTAKFLLLRRKIADAYARIPYTPQPLEVARNAVNALTFDGYVDGQAVVILNRDPRMIFDRTLLRDYARSRIDGNLPVLNPMTNQKITDIEPRLSVLAVAAAEAVAAAAEGGKRSTKRSTKRSSSRKTKTKVNRKQKKN